MTTKKTRRRVLALLLLLSLATGCATLGGTGPELAPHLAPPGAVLECRALEVAAVTVRAASAFALAELEARRAVSCQPVAPPLAPLPPAAPPPAVETAPALPEAGSGRNAGRRTRHAWTPTLPTWARTPSPAATGGWAPWAASTRPSTA